MPLLALLNSLALLPPALRPALKRLALALIVVLLVSMNFYQYQQAQLTAQSIKLREKQLRFTLIDSILDSETQAEITRLESLQKRVDAGAKEQSTFYSTQRASDIELEKRYTEQHFVLPNVADLPHPGPRPN